MARLVNKIEWVKWGENGRLQNKYDQTDDIKTGDRYQRVCRRVWKLKRRLEAEIQHSYGWDQKPIYRNRKSLQQQHIIYCIFSVKSTKLYIGQTRNSAQVRFHQHVVDALAKRDNMPLHAAIRKLGWRSFYIFPLIVFPSADVFGQKADMLERETIRRIQSFLPYGWNVKWGKRKRKHRKRFRRSMLHRKDPRPNIGSAVSVRLFGYRGWGRRVANMVSVCQRWDRDELLKRLEKYSLLNIHRIRDYLSFLIFRSNDEEMIFSCIRVYLDGRYKFRSVKAKNIDDCSIFRVLWQSTCITNIPFRQILMSTQSKHMLGVAADCVTNVRIVRKLIKPVSTMIYNHSEFVRGLTMVEDGGDGSQCPCRKYDGKYRPDNGCVRTGDITIIENDFLRNIFSYGPKFRTNIVKRPHTIIENAVNEFINIIRRKHPILPNNFFVNWKRYFITTCLSYFNKPAEREFINLNQDAVKYLHMIKTIFIISPVDKAAGNYSFTCKRLYKDILIKELHKPNGAYLTSNNTVNDILTRHKSFLLQIGLWNDKADFQKLPGMQVLNKFHKVPVGSRFIATSAKCTTTKMSVFVSKVIQFFMSELAKNDDVCFANTGIRRYFVVRSYQEVIEFASKLRCNARVLGSGDFSTMYTAIPHQDLCDRLTRVINEVRVIGKTVLNVLNDNAVFIDYVSNTGVVKWLSAPRGNREVRTKARQSISLDTFITTFQFMVNNVYVSVGDKLYRQTIGVPMGTNSGGDIANLYLFSYESSYIDRLVTSGETVKAKCFCNTARLIDDTLSLDNPHWQSAVTVSAENGGMYPGVLPYNDTRKNSFETNFIGMRIVINAKRKVELDVFDKRKEFKFQVQRYPNMKSFIPEGIPYGVFIGQLHRYYDICCQPKAFICNSVWLASMLIQQGCARTKILRCFYSFLVHKQRQRNRVKWKTSLHWLRLRFISALGQTK